MKIKIVAIGKIPPLLLQRLPAKLVETFKPLVDGYSVVTSGSIPSTAFDAQRRQYRAETILHQLVYGGERDAVILGIVDVDLYVPGLNFVFGLSQLLGRGALVSIHRLKPDFYGETSDPELLWDRTQKEAIHELGHVFGLNHCGNQNCVMSFSNSILDVDRKSSNFCDRCRAKLLRRP